MQSKDIKRFSIILIIILVLFYYLLNLMLKPKPLIDIWPLEGFFGETITVIVVIIFLCILLRDRISIIIPLIIQIFLMIILPVLKYPNELNIAGPWDSNAHYSFAKWIIVHGHVESSGKLMYSLSYGFHPGNGIIPAILTYISSINLGWSMNILLITIHSGYVLLLLVTLKNLDQSVLKNMNIVKAMWLMAIFTLAIERQLHYSGLTLGYIYVSSIMNVLIKWLFDYKKTFNKNVFTLILLFLGMLCTHLSTAVIMIVYLLITTIMLFVIKPFKGINTYTTRTNSKTLITLSLVMVLIFIVYELYVDVFLFRKSLQDAFYNLYYRYIREIKTLNEVSEYREISLGDAILHLVSNFTKRIIVLGLIFIHTIVFIIRRNYLSSYDKLLALLLFASYPTLLVSWVGVGSIIFSSIRACSLICFLLVLNLVLIYKNYYNTLIRKSLLVVPLILIIFGFIANFGLPFHPTIQDNGEMYVYPTYYQVGFSNYALHPVKYLSSYPTCLPFLCMQPFVTFGLCDHLWNTPRIPKPIYGFIAPKMMSPQNIIEIIKNYQNVIVPQPMRDRLLPGPIGFHSLYEKPFQFLLERGKGLIYNNGLYTLFYY